MNPFPHDIFTEPSGVDPDTLANLGPLTRLAGRWEAAKGVDINPKAEAPERRTFIERINFDAIDPQTNGPQLLYGLRYHIHITTREEDITFHEQVGYWLWEPATGLVMQTLAIPRGQVALASGQAKPGDDMLTLTATRGHTDYGICSTAFSNMASAPMPTASISRSRATTPGPTTSRRHCSSTAAPTRSTITTRTGCTGWDRRGPTRGNRYWIARRGRSGVTANGRFH